MSNNNEFEPVLVVRDAGYNKTKLLSQEYRKKVQDKIKNPNIDRLNLQSGFLIFVLNHI